MAPQAVARRLTAALLAACCLAIGCGRRTADATATWMIEPTPAVANRAAIVRCTLRTGGGEPLRGARLRLEAHMSHPGMAPATADMNESAAGVYEARVQLSMPGQWVLVAAGELRDGSRITRQVEVTAVAPSG
jgi:hypothetical protein